MKRFILAPALAALALSTAPLDGAAPVVSNLTAAQRTGTKLVDIGYGVTADAPTVDVFLEISSDGGTTFSVPAATVNGSIGAGVAIGTGKTITWDAGADWGGQFNAGMRFKVTASEPLTGFSFIPAGAFTMGDSLDGLADAPTRTVTMSAFYMAKTEVTKADWDAVKAWGVTHGYTNMSAGASRGANYPVDSVNWWEGIKWCNARSEKEGLTPCYSQFGAVLRSPSSSATTPPDVNWAANGYRLPTEAQWEKAARGGLSGKRFPWGDTISHSLANFRNSGGEPYQSGTTGYHPTYGTYTAPVGSFPANGYGLYDMAGNVAEWCWDWYGGAYAPGPQTDPRGGSGVLYRTYRGGDWGYPAGVARVAVRSDTNGYPGGASSVVGFRPARNASPANYSNVQTSNVMVDTRPNVALTTTAQHGTVTGAGEYAPDTTATVAATPAPGYLFAGWTGDATGTDNPLSVLMDADKTVAANFSPDTNDDDGDGLTNYQEIVEKGTDPTKQDTDGDGAKDKADAFPLDPAETLDTDNDGTGDNADTDDDNDGYSDADETTIHHTNPKLADSDGDGLSDPAELETHHTNPNLADTDSDGLGDGEEFVTHHTDPLKGDTDGDGFLDGYEVYTGHAPLDIADKPALVAEARTAIEFTFPAAIGKTYRIEASTDLETWGIVEIGIAGNGSVIQRFYSTRGMPMRYFRVEDETP